MQSFRLSEKTFSLFFVCCFYFMVWSKAIFGLVWCKRIEIESFQIGQPCSRLCVCKRSEDCFLLPRTLIVVFACEAVFPRNRKFKELFEKFLYLEGYLATSLQEKFFKSVFKRSIVFRRILREFCKKFLYNLSGLTRICMYIFFGYYVHNVKK